MDDIKNLAIKAGYFPIPDHEHAYLAWIAGYKAAQNKCNKDIEKAIKLAQEYSVDTQWDEYDVMHEILKHTYSSEQIIKLLKNNHG